MTDEKQISCKHIRNPWLDCSLQQGYIKVDLLYFWPVHFKTYYKNSFILKKKSELQPFDSYPTNV